MHPFDSRRLDGEHQNNICVGVLFYERVISESENFYCLNSNYI